MTDPQNTASLAAPVASLKDAVARVMRHQDAQRWEDAGALLEELRAAHGDLPILVHYSGMNAFGQGDREGGIALTEEALREHPNDPVMLCGYGSQLARCDRLDDAIEEFQSAVEAAPNYALAQGNLGAALLVKQDLQRAIPRLKRAIELDSRLLDAHINLASAYVDTNQFELAVEILFKALSLNPLDPQIHARLSGALYRNERHDSAEYHARRAIELAPNAGEPYLHLGNVLASSGRVDEAAEALLVASARPGTGLAALARLIHLRKTTPDAPELAQLERFLDNPERLSEEAKASLFYAAGKAFDSLKDHPRAFDYFRLANDISKELHPFDVDDFLRKSDSLLSFLDKDMLSRCGGGGLDSVAPIFICGMPRSGTTLMEQMFSRHPRVQAGGEMSAAVVALQGHERIKAALEGNEDSPQLTQDDFKILGEDYVASVRSSGLRTPFFTDKMPINYRHIGLLALALPRAKFLIMRRHPLDCLLSNYFQSFGRNQPFATDLENMALVYGAYDAHARHWVKMFPEAVREVSYEDVVDDARGVFEGVLGFVGLPWDDAVLDHKASTHQVNTASISQVREPIYRRAVARWKPYAEELQPLVAALKKHAPHVTV